VLYIVPLVCKAMDVNELFVKCSSVQQQETVAVVEFWACKPI